ncbi:MAG: aldo/keto reductase, partial [Clostridia bacterium]|nr:aldo/keto reductase [Clostridia bacterium]
MKYRHIEKLGIDISAFGLGCMRLPMMKDEDGKDVVDEKKWVDIIRRCIDGGVNYLDTAYVYTGGLNEKYVGLALRDGYREKVYLATKLPLWDCDSKEYMYKTFEEQLTRLETDYIDFY